MLEQNARLIATDFGRPEEAFFYRVARVTLRTETEWPELVEWGGTSFCVGSRLITLCIYTF